MAVNRNSGGQDSIWKKEKHQLEPLIGLLEKQVSTHV